MGGGGVADFDEGKLAGGGAVVLLVGGRGALGGVEEQGKQRQ
jgi:hypothetical protein